MKNYGHTWQWGDNPEYTINIWTNWDRWALPLVISWNRFTDGICNKNCSLDIGFLCFGFNIEVWRWNK